ncbi:MAG: aminotransferase class I/II-fold pyridoxal phosphate-dependent enzyme, partial [Nocardioides sp.]
MELAALVDAPAALVTSTGYHANLAVLSALADRDTLVVSDAHVHASLIDGIRLARAEVVVAPHLDVAAVASALDAAAGRRVLVVVESVYSVLGDAAPLASLAELAAARDALLVVDEAHGLGVAGNDGRGLVHQLGLGRDPHVVATATLSKAFGAQGGAVLGAPAILDQVVNRGRPFVYDTGLAPPSAGAALAAVRLVRTEPHRAALVRSRIGA